MIILVIEFDPLQPQSLNPFPNRRFETIPNSKKLQTTTEMWLLKDFEIQDPFKKHCRKR